jgi:hypothetical protein
VRETLSRLTNDIVGIFALLSPPRTGSERRGGKEQQFQPPVRLGWRKKNVEFDAKRTMC